MNLFFGYDRPDIYYRNDNDDGVRKKGIPWRKEFKHTITLYRIFNYLRSLGWIIENDKSVAKCIQYCRFYGKYKELEFKANTYPAGFKIEFFQSINVENPHGGYYDFDRYEKMPYLTKKRFILTCNKIKDFCEKVLNIPGELEIAKSKLSAESWIKQDYVEKWHHPEKDIHFDLNDTTLGEYDTEYNANDKNNKRIKQGDIKYSYYWRTKRIARGKCYHNINNMWWVILNKHEFANVACFELFDEPKNLRGRNTHQRELTELQKLKSENKKLKNKLKNIELSKRKRR